MNFNCIKTVMIAAAAMISLNSFSQDLIARQAPIDRKLKSVDSLALQKQIRAEQSEYPALSLYPNWNNQYVHAYGKDAIIPDSYTIDLTGFHMPTPSTRITSPFGPRWRRMHNGLDIKVNIGDTIVAAFDGKVRIVKYERRGYGKYVVIRHDNGLETVYGHLSKQLVEENGFRKSMSRPGTPSDNQPIESFWKTLESEMEDIRHLTFEEASRMIVDYIELYYNSERLHSGIGYYIPNNFFTLLSVH